MSKEIETEGKSVTIAVEQGLRELNLRRDEVEVTVLEEGNAGFLGMGAKPARVLIRPKRWEDGKRVDSGASEAAKEAAKPKAPAAKKKAREEAPDDDRPVRPARPVREKREPKRAPAARKTPSASEPVDKEKACAEAKAVLERLLDLAGASYESVACTWDDAQERVRAEVESEDGALLIGQHGRTIESIQFLVTVILGRRLGTPTAVQVETEGYWERLEGEIIAETQRAVEHIKKDGGAYRFEPMDPALRRLIHRKLADHPEVVTVSEGEGPSRKVVVRSRSADAKR